MTHQRRRRGVPIAMSTLVTLIERAAELLSGIDGLHWKQLLASRWMATDGTGLKVLVPKLPVAHNGYIKLYRNRVAAVFQHGILRLWPTVCGPAREGPTASRASAPLSCHPATWRR
jgi:hypothetical protein